MKERLEHSPTEVSRRVEGEARRSFPLNEVLALLTGVAVPSGSSVTFGQDLWRFLFKGMPDWDSSALSADKRFKISGLVILSQHPELGAVRGDAVSRDNAESWSAEQVVRFGSELEFKPIDEHFLLEELAKRI
ncbi:MAG: hypothetical protein V1664_02545 [Candidatus Uhrbacteria bacterium]